jgi:photosystem II stability/assembly factor-like uncharacterized protein
MNRNILSVSAIMVICLACTEFPDPTDTVVEKYTYTGSGLGQKAFAGEYLTDSIVVNIRDDIAQRCPAGMEVHFEVTAGGGEVDKAIVTTNSQGNASTRWKLGNSGNEQLLKAMIFTADGAYRSVVPIQATAFLNNAWNTVSCTPDIWLTDMAADSINGFTFAIANSVLYKQGERFFDWLPVDDFPVNLPRRIVIGKDRTWYIGTWEGTLYKSLNQGITWIACAKPWPDHPYYFHLQVTSDNYIWTTALGRGLRCSRDGGLTWSTDTIGLPAAEMLGDIFRLSDGTLFFHSLNCHLSKSEDDGHTWTRVNSPQYSLKLYVNNKDELILINQYSVMSIYKSIDKGESFILKKTLGSSFSTLMDHTVHQRGKDYYLLIPGYGILHTKDFDKYDTFWMNEKVNDMFMDAHGNLLVKELYMQEVHYWSTP